MTVSLSQFDDFINNNSLLTHYFYEQKWNNGELSQEDLALYAKEYFHLANRVPVMVSSIRDRALERGDTELVAEIEKNIEEEAEHAVLWKRFAKSLGVTEEEIEAYQPTQTTLNAVEELEELMEGSLEDGVTAMYAMELSLPAIAETKKDGLSKLYGLHSEDAHKYFDEHLGEEEHLKVWRQVEVNPERAQTITAASLQAQHKVLDGVCEVCGFCISCNSDSVQS